MEKVAKEILLITAIWVCGFIIGHMSSYKRLEKHPDKVVHMLENSGYEVTLTDSTIFIVDTLKTDTNER